MQLIWQEIHVCKSELGGVDAVGIQASDGTRLLKLCFNDNIDWSWTGA